MDAAAQFDSEGFVVLPALDTLVDCDAVVEQLKQVVTGAPGSRSLLSLPWCQSLARLIRNNTLLGAMLPRNAVAVQCTYFEKSESQNWLVAVHQDLSIPVRERLNSNSCAGWTVKEDVVFVQPPIEVLEGLVAVRLHLDPSTAENGPLRVVPGSHRLGRLSATQIQAARAERGEVTCAVPKGGSLVMRPLLLHASSKAQERTPRRVLHFVFGAAPLPEGLAWHTAV